MVMKPFDPMERTCVCVFTAASVLASNEPRDETAELSLLTDH